MSFIMSYIKICLKGNAAQATIKPLQRHHTWKYSAEEFVLAINDHLKNIVRTDQITTAIFTPMLLIKPKLHISSP